ncbi:predicted transcriptional regulator [Hahella chejuensis KCTC 2396]|uniref:Predicted transcriptional regulator n=1 Tax=Hahella chejuensis (strain KCTC 2396) TaxID=349521 RepID=Q2SLI4_HAHCH|nr:XRE family transcriptional regulator [Hahella chejuensis]ABC28490.1 predicted transcriptional regulator [Hahella chejuensis KCTC 2396]
MKDTDLVARLGKRIQQLRKSEKLTLEQLAQQSNVSRSMLSQIERGQANPTFATLWNLTRAMGIEWSELVDESEGVSHSPIEHIIAAQTPKIDNPQGGYHLSILSPPHLVGSIEWYELRMRPQGKLESQAHTQGCMEHLTVLSGQLEVVSGTQSQRLAQGDTARYHADVAHTIQNPGDSDTIALLVVMNHSHR